MSGKNERKPLSVPPAVKKELAKLPKAAYFGLSGQRFRHHSDKRSGVVRTS